jgi:uncharacterized MAPEG superfamily protein
MLTATALLTSTLVLPDGLAKMTLWPMREVLGNRAAPPPLPPWAERAERARWNMLENFPHFAVFVVVAHVAGMANEQTALGATIFFWARLVHAVVYITGTWSLRAPAYFAAVTGEWLIVSRLLGWSPGLVVPALAVVIFSSIVVLRRYASRAGLSMVPAAATPHHRKGGLAG